MDSTNRVSAAARWSLHENSEAIQLVLGELAKTLRKHQLAAAHALYLATFEEATRLLNGRDLDRLPDTLSCLVVEEVNRLVASCSISPWEEEVTSGTAATEDTALQER